MIDVKDCLEIVKVSIDDPASLKRLTQSGWIILGVAPCDVRAVFNKTHPYVSDGSSYVQTHGYTEEGVERSLVTIVGLPKVTAIASWRAEIDSLVDSISKTKDALVTSTTKLAEREASLAKAAMDLKAKEEGLQSAATRIATVMSENNTLKAELTKLRLGMSQLVSKVGGATLAELEEQDAIEAEIKKAAGVAD